MINNISQQKNNGFVLVATLLLGMALALVSVSFMQSVVTSSQTLNAQTYRALASEAAEAGSIYAGSCIGLTEIQWTTLTPNTSCDDTTNTSPNTVSKSSGSGSGIRWESTFTVAGAKNTTDTSFIETARNFVFTTNGKVTVYQGSIAIASFKVSKTSRIDKINQLIAPSPTTRNAITDLSSDTHSCVIANGQLYCWGANNKGQLGDNTTVPKNTPTLVSALSGKMVTKVAVGTENTCAVADGKLYCWGDNTYGQLGVGTGYSSGFKAPNTSASPVGPLNNRKVTDVAVSQGATGSKSACAVADGIVYCWGANDKQQLGLSSPTVPNTTPQSTPQIVYGYSSSAPTDSAFYNKKATSVSVGSTGACAVAAAQEICWGDASFVPYPFIHSGQGDYNFTGGNPAIYVNPNGTKVTGNTACALIMVNWLMCHAQSNTLKKYNQSDPAHPTISLDIYPKLVTQFTGITDFDGGSTGTDEQYCIISYTNPYCQGTSNTGTNDQNTPPPPAYVDAPQAYFKQLTANNLNQLDSHVATTYNKASTSIGVGNNYGCLIASAELFCWGTDTNGTLANGVTSGTKYYYPVHVASSSLGFTEDTLSADGPISMGKNHGCTIINAVAMCWGANDKGQLGSGNTVSKNQPTNAQIIATGTGPKTFLNSNKVSASGDHSCALSGAYIYCWGGNANGEVGINSTASAIVKPTEVSYFRDNGLIPTDVSSGPSGTCAIAFGEAYCWGKNDHKQVGNASAAANQLTPLKVTALSGKMTTSISVGATHTCAIANGDAYCWGSNTNGELGIAAGSDQVNAVKIAATAAGSGTPMATTSGSSVNGATFTAISAGNNYTCGIINGSAACWGNSADGKLGSSASTTSNPTFVTDLSGMQATAISAGDKHACAVANGKTYCWGNQTNGRLGDGTSTNTTRTSPTRTILINGNGGALTSALASTHVAAGDSSTCSIANRLIYCWGNNNTDQLGNGDLAHGNQSLSVVTDKYRYISTQSRGPFF